MEAPQHKGGKMRFQERKSKYPNRWIIQTKENTEDGKKIY